MDQNRLEELKRLLQKRRGSAKQNRSEKLDVENSETKNSETENSEVSNSKALNFEIQNSEVSNFESQDSEVSNSKPSNFETPNSKNINSDPGALNLEIGAALNSACENSAEQQNFTSNDSGSLRQNSKAGDYDKYPIVVNKDRRSVLADSSWNFVNLFFNTEF